jgi:hypothetical protein
MDFDRSGEYPASLHANAVTLRHANGSLNRW